jgi:hypothetical protein
MFLFIAESLLIDLLDLLLHLVDFATNGGEALLDGVLELVGDHIEVLLLDLLEFIDLVAEGVLSFQFILQLLDLLLVLFDQIAQVDVLT